MSVFNLGVVFGPTLLRPQEETVAAILDIKFNNIVINILIENYERIFKTDPTTSTALMTANSPPTRTPRANQISKTTTNTGSGVSTARTSMYSPQQQVYRVVTKSNYTEPSMSSSLQNIPNGMIYGHHGPVSNPSNTNGGGGSNSASHNANGIANNKNLSVNMGSIKNIHSMSQSDISVRRNGGGEGVYGLVSGTNGTSALTSHHATPATASTLRHDFLMATATPVASSTGTNHLHGSRLNMNNVSPPSLAMRTEALYGTTGVLNSANANLPHNARGGGVSVGVVGGNHMSYAQAKHYSPVAAASTSSSNESVCDSLSSTNGGGGVVGVGGIGNSGRILSGRSSLDYVPHVSQASSLSTLLGSTCDDVVTATAATSMLVGGGGSVGGHSPNETDYVPQKMHRNKDVSQIKRDLSAGTARVRTLYACMGESEGELSFEPNQIITNVRFSHEPGWLQGTLNGKTGLIPENYE